MLKYFPKILTIFFLAIFIFQLSCLLFLALAPKTGNAADDIEFTPQIQVGDYKFDSGDKSTGNIARYIREIYKYAIGIVGILAAVVLMVGGVLWIIAGGNSTAVGEAKSWIGASLTGLVIALCSYLILATVNPALVDLKTTGIKKVAPSLITNFDDSVPCGQPVSNQKIICGSKCPGGQTCKKTIKGTIAIGARECPMTLPAGSGDYYICSSLSGDGIVCDENVDCLDGFECSSRRCRATTATQEGVTCNSRNCVAPLKCVFYFVAYYPGVCYDGSSGDPCCYNSDCQSNNCSRPWYSVCAVKNMYDYTCN